MVYMYIHLSRSLSLHFNQLSTSTAFSGPSGGQIGRHQVGWLVVLRINVDLAIFQQYLGLEAGDNQSLKIQMARPGI